MCVLLAVGCLGPTRADADRANSLADDPIFDALSQQWEPTQDVSVIPAVEPPNNGGTGLVSQAYVRPDPFVDDAELGFAARALEQAGWVAVTVDCDNMQVRGFKNDGHGRVRVTIRLSDHLPTEDIWAQILVSPLSEESEEFLEVLDRPGDKGCLAT